MHDKSFCDVCVSALKREEIKQILIAVPGARYNQVRGIITAKNFGVADRIRAMKSEVVRSRFADEWL